jgi:hypothetical protein
MHNLSILLHSDVQEIRLTGGDHSPSRLQQLKAVFNKLDKQRQWIPTSHAYHNAQQGVLSTNDPFFGRFWQQARCG